MQPETAAMSWAASSEEERAPGPGLTDDGVEALSASDHTG